MDIKIWNKWDTILKKEFKSPYFKEIIKKLNKDIDDKKIIYPSIENIFNAFIKTDFFDIKVVILWQDPYHNEWQAHWLSFSVPFWTKIPPSLKNIFKEYSDDLWYEFPNHWNLEKWSKQWVFLLNSILTVEKNKPASHLKIWWEQFSDNVIKEISDKRENIVFILWWNYAINKKSLINESKHFIITSPHPSPFSARRGFFWSKPFTKTNMFLKNKNIWEIDWKL